MSDILAGIAWGSAVTFWLCTWWLNREARDWKAICDKHWEIIEELQEQRNEAIEAAVAMKRASGGKS